jgi:ketosteroid isomerase-like protein
MSRAWLLALACLVLLWAGCAPPLIQNYQPKDATEAQIVAQLVKIPNAVKARNVDLMMQAYSDDVYIANFSKYLGVASPTAPLSISKAELRATYGELFRGQAEISMDVKNLKLTVTGDRATAEAYTEMLFKQEAGRGENKKGQLYRNDVIWRLRRTPLGWRIYEEVWQ